MTSPESLMLRQYIKNHLVLKPGEQLTVLEQRQRLEKLNSRVPIDPDVQVEKVTIERVHGEWVTVPAAVDGRVFLYLHGGGYIMGSCNTHRNLAARLSRSTATSALVIEYRLAPEHPFPAALEDAASTYRWLVLSGVAPEHIIIGGDSAGGNLTMATLLSLRDAGDPLPAAAVLLSPWTDMEGTGESMSTRAEFDPWLNPEEIRAMPAMYIRDLDRRHPLVSPIYADLHGLPPMLVHVGSDDCLLDDSVRLVKRAEAAGVDVTFKIWEGMWHVFQSFAANLPEGRQSIEEIGRYVRKKLGS